MTPVDLRTLCMALGFTVVVLRGEKLPKKEGALRAAGFANLIEEFCRTALGDAAMQDGQDKFAAAHRMAAAMAGMIRKNGACLPQDLIAAGFTPDEVDRHWTMAKALAYTALNIRDA